MNSKKITTKSPEETVAFGRHLAKSLKSGDIVCLFGDLGSGKTTLIKGIAAGLKVDLKDVSSPTFVLMNIYEGRLPVYHFDLYRLEDIEGIAAIGYDEFFYGDGVSVIEWADRLGDFMPDEYLRIDIEHRKLDERVIHLSVKGSRNLTVESGGLYYKNGF